MTPSRIRRYRRPLTTSDQSSHDTRHPLPRTYWEFFSGFGFFVTALLLFSAYVAWYIGRLPSDARRMLSPLVWAFAIAYVVIAILTWRHFFLAPSILATITALLLVIGALTVVTQRSAAVSAG